MTARLAYPPADPTPPPSSTNVGTADAKAPAEPHTPYAPTERAIWLRPEPAAAVLDRTPFLGSRARREALWTDVSRDAIERGTELAAAQNDAAFRAWRAGLSDADLAAADDALRAHEWAELDVEEAGRTGPLGFIPPRLEDIAPKDRDHRAVLRFLPPELSPFLIRMNPARRREREQAILDYVGWEGLALLGLGPAMLADRAMKKAREYAVRYPGRDEDGDEINQEPVHRKGRCHKWHRRRLLKKQTRALLYVEQAVGAVGGPSAPGRPLYVSDYLLTLHREQVRLTAETLERLRLVLVEDPTVQIPMTLLNEKAKVADVTKRMLLIDMLLRRYAELGWHVCWITITLPGRYVAHATNEDRRAEAWDVRLGPQEALGAIQEIHHQTMALLRERGVRPCGWWNAQPQQSGTPHRHIVVACRTREDARAVCDAFWDRFSSTPIDKRQEERRREDPGCSAYILGDEDSRYAPSNGKNGTAETAASVARYAARYSTRCEKRSRREDGTNASTGTAPAEADQQDGEQERFAAWKARRRVRGHTWIGFDSSRSPMEQWDTLWANAMRDDYEPDDPRMALAMRMMKDARAHSAIARDAWAAAKMEPGKDRDDMLRTAQRAADDAAHAAWHAGIAMGLWADTDLDPIELEWLRSETEEADALPPMPLRVTKETTYGEQRRTVIGSVAPERRFTVTGRCSVRKLLPIAHELGVVVETDGRGKLRPRDILAALKREGFGLLRRPDGSRAGFDLSGEVLLRTEKEWKVMDIDQAAEMVEEAEKRAAAEARRVALLREAVRRGLLDGMGMVKVDAVQDWAPAASVSRSFHTPLSDSPTDPSYGPAAHAGHDRRGDDPPS